jgi:hypothetical protein
VDAWLSEVMHSLQNGKRCLVLYGPSRLDKIEVVRALFGVGSVQEFNCAGLVSICLHDFDNLKHECLLWDEASPKLVADNRKVFQHPACKVKLGHSPTGQHVVIILYDCCFAITLSSRHEDLLRLPLPDQQWLRATCQCGGLRCCTASVAECASRVRQVSVCV